MRLRWQLLLAVALALGTSAVAATTNSAASSGRYCDPQLTLTAQQQDRLLRFAAVVRLKLDGAGSGVALISRNGTDLRRFGLRYSHAGISLKTSEQGAWSVRQLYYACEEGRPRIFDQGLPGFVLGTDDPERSYLSVLLLPQYEGRALEDAALDNRRALALLGGTYSANAHIASLKYQNCNQWLIELLASAWGALPVAEDLRARAQAWLTTQGYAPPPVRVDSHLLMLVAPLIAHLHWDDHSEEDRQSLQVRTSVPATIEAFVRQRVPDVQRLEFCLNGERVVMRRGWMPLPEGCVSGEGDEVMALTLD
jgi:hypothetical protein